jgi:hypothetical protein
MSNQDKDSKASKSRAESPVKSEHSSWSDVAAAPTKFEPIKVPYGPIQQAMLARKTKAIDIQIETKSREKVLALSMEMDQLDSEFLQDVYLSIRNVDIDIYNALLDSELCVPMADLDLHGICLQITTANQIGSLTII